MGQIRSGGRTEGKRQTTHELSSLVGILSFPSGSARASTLARLSSTSWSWETRRGGHGSCMGASLISVP